MISLPLLTFKNYFSSEMGFIWELQGTATRDMRYNGEPSLRNALSLSWEGLLETKSPGEETESFKYSGFSLAE